MLKRTTVALSVFFVVLLALPAQSFAAFSLGGDVIWIPAASQSIAGSDVDASHDVASMGFSGHGRIGFDFASAGLKLNYFSQGIDLPGTGDIRQNQLDINGLVRVGIPATGIAAFAEAGPTLTTDFNGVGYNIGLAGQYTLFDLHFISIHGGVEGQYVKLPASVNDHQTDISSKRLMLFAGVEFGI